MKVIVCLDCGSSKSPKGLYCKKCGYKHRIRPHGLVYQLKKINKAWFKKGHIPWSKGLDGSYLPHWKGDNVSRDSLHDWVERHLGKPQKCEKCKTTTGHFQWSNKSGLYKRNFSDWQRLCAKCHWRYDYEKFGIKRGLSI